MVDVKIDIKNNLEVLIENGELEIAKMISDQYKELVSDDLEIYSIIGVILIKMNKLNEAKIILKEGLLIDNNSYDINYNLAYVYESLGKYDKSLIYYEKAYNSTNIKENREQIEIIVENIINNLDINEIDKKLIKRRKILIIAYFFPPLGGAGVQRTLKYVKYLRSFGWEPVVVTVGKSSYFAKDETLLNDIPEDVSILRIDDVDDIELNNDFINELVNMYCEITNNDNIIGDYLNILQENNESFQKYIFMPNFYSAWSLKVLNRIENSIDLDEIDLIYTTSSPEADHFIGYFLKKKFNIPWVVDFRDEWTNNPYVEYDTSNIKYKMEHCMEANIVNMADKIITTTPFATENYINIFNLEESKVKTVTNGYDEEDFIGIEHNNIKNEKFTITHNGFFYGVRTPEYFLSAVGNLIKKNKIDRNRIKIRFTRSIGNNYIRELIQKNNLDNIVECIGYLTHHESLQLCAQSDLLLLVLGREEKCKSIFTGKVFEYLRSNKPILSLGPSGGLVDELLENTRRGINVNFENIEQIERVIFDYYQKWINNEQEQYEVNEFIKRYDRRSLTEDLSNIFDNLVVDEKALDIIKKEIINVDYDEAERELKNLLRQNNNDF